MTDAQSVYWWERVIPTEGCWHWTGTLMSSGYGVVSWMRKQVGAHRLSYEMFKGTIPPGTLVCHTCDNPACVNPEHLFLGTHKENSLDAARKCRVNHGEKHPHHKLTVKAVQEIRNLLKRDPRGAKRIAKRYGVSDVAVYRIKNGTAWISDPAPNMEV